MKIPARARAAIRKMHREWGHLNHTVLKKILKAAKAPQEYLDAVDAHLCHGCVANAPKAPQTTKVGPPRHPYEFNHTVGVDVFDLHDDDGQGWLFLNIVDMGTNFQIVTLLCQGPGVPSSRLCGQAFMTSWVSWAGWPKDLVADRGLHNREYFARMLGAHGICPHNTGLESPEQLGRVERHGKLWKTTAKRVIHGQKLKG